MIIVNTGNTRKIGVVKRSRWQGMRLSVRTPEIRGLLTSLVIMHEKTHGWYPELADTPHLPAVKWFILGIRSWRMHCYDDHHD
jgi:hypothetical protein